MIQEKWRRTVASEEGSQRIKDDDNVCFISVAESKEDHYSENTVHVEMILLYPGRALYGNAQQMYPSM
jgi:hypothetical protein